MKKSTKNILSVIASISLILGVIYTTLLIFEKIYHPQPKLLYSLRVHGITTEGDKFIPAKKDIFNNFPKELVVAYLVIENVGNKELNYSDIYESDTLRIEMNKNALYSAIEVKENPKYINFKIDKIQNGTIYLKFDTIEPGDMIAIRILGNGFIDNMKITARSKYFDKIDPIDFETADLNKSNVDFETWYKLKPKSAIYYIFIIFSVIILLFTIFQKSRISEKIETKED